MQSEVLLSYSRIKLYCFAPTWHIEHNTLHNADMQKSTDLQFWKLRRHIKQTCLIQRKRPVWAWHSQGLFCNESFKIHKTVWSRPVVTKGAQVLRPILLNTICTIMFYTSKRTNVIPVKAPGCHSVFFGCLNDMLIWLAHSTRFARRIFIPCQYLCVFFLWLKVNFFQSD